MNKNRALFITLVFITSPIAASYSVGIDFIDAPNMPFRVVQLFNSIHSTVHRAAIDMYDKTSMSFLLGDTTIQECIPLIHKEIDTSLKTQNRISTREKFVRDSLFTKYDALQKDEYSFKYNATEPGLIEITTTIHYKDSKEFDPDYALESEKNQLKYIAARALGNTVCKEKDTYVLRYSIKTPKKDFFDRYDAYDKQQQSLTQPEQAAAKKSSDIVAQTSTPTTPVSPASTLPPAPPSSELSSKIGATTKEPGLVV